MKRIAVEEAFVTQEISEQWKTFLHSGAPDESGFLKMGETILADLPSNRRLHEQLLDLADHRIQDMDEAGIDVQVISLTSPGVQIFEGELAAELASKSNEQLSKAVLAHPQRFAGLAAIAPQLPETAAEEIRRAKNELNLKGIIINSHTGGKYLDAEEYRPIFETAESLDMPIYLHPRTPSPEMIKPYMDYGLYFAGWGFAAETSLHAMRLIMSGTFDRFPGLKIILGHMGEGIPFWLDRIDNRYLLQVKIGAIDKMQKLPSEYFLDNFLVTTSGMNYLAPFRLAYEVLGAERILFASDYPYESMNESIKLLDSIEIPEDDRKNIYHRNSELLFDL